MKAALFHAKTSFPNDQHLPLLPRPARAREWGVDLRPVLAALVLGSNSDTRRLYAYLPEGANFRP